ncbi:MAG: hypothetical protein U1E45_14020 [Geminicoccaceae bacterium]
MGLAIAFDVEVGEAGGDLAGGVAVAVEERQLDGSNNLAVSGSI